jgi:DNA (cytosine-5)-methyltransferase 1
MFVFENVPGLLTANEGTYYRNLKKYFRRIKYEIDDRILNSKDFGVLQDRQRVFIVGWRKNLNLEFPNLELVSHSFTTEKIFEDLAPISPGQSLPRDKYRCADNEYLTQFGLRCKSGYYTQHIARPHNSNDLEIYRFVIKMWNDEQRRAKYPDIPSKLRTQKNIKSFLDRYKVVNGGGLSHTVIAHIAKDGHHYIHPDINQCRSISVREAARIQSFPDDFYFEGARTSAFRQIGNAVPPLVSFALAGAIKERLETL